MTRAAKRRRTARQPPPSKSMINELPDILLVEILCRLPLTKAVHQCKLVSKRWCTLLSDPYFVGRFLRLQCDQQTPLLHAYAMIPGIGPKNTTSVLTIWSEPPYLVVDKTKSIFSLLPCFQDPIHADKGETMLAVAGTYNDLILCSPTESTQSDYYICNSYTKEWVRLPPTPRVETYYVPVGFICDPYYSTNKEDGTSSNSSVIRLNSEYRCKVVRLLPDDSNGFSVEIYSSETGVACNGKLYWWNDRGFVFELDPFNMRSTNNDIIDTCRFIYAPSRTVFCFPARHIGVCQGRLRMCPFWFRASEDPVPIWELKENPVDGKPVWLLLCDGVTLSQMVHKEPSVFSDPWLLPQVLGFHPTDRDILYLQYPKRTVKCNFREKTLETASANPFFEYGLSSYYGYYSHRESYPLVFPWWPTPIQKRLHYCKDYNATVTEEDPEIHSVEDCCGKPARSELG